MTSRDADRAAQMKRCGYTHMLRYTAEHSGDRHSVMAGAIREDSLPFCSAADAEGWVAAINAIFARKPSHNGYRVIAHTIEAL